MNNPYYTDDVRGIITGGDEQVVCYKFYTIVPPGVEHYLGKDWFSDDETARAYAATCWPDAYKNGIEMRVFDKVRHE